MDNNLQIHFLGAAGTVTGSKYLVEFSGKKIMVDCGLFQGLKKLRQLNWDYPPVEATAIDAVCVDPCSSRPHWVPAEIGQIRL